MTNCYLQMHPLILIFLLLLLVIFYLRPYLVVGYSKGLIILYNYETHEEVISTKLPETEDAVISSIKFSPQCLFKFFVDVFITLYFFRSSFSLWPIKWRIMVITAGHFRPNLCRTIQI